MIRTGYSTRPHRWCLQDAVEDVERLEKWLAKETADLALPIPLSTPQRVAEVTRLLKRAKKEVKRMEKDGRSQ